MAKPDIEITDELTDKLCTLIEDGNYPETVAVYSGVSIYRFRKWLEEGNEYLLQHDSGVDVSGWGEDEWRLANFSYAVNLAYATAEIEHLREAKSLARQGKSSWTMFFTWLERCRPGWQRREKISAEPSVDQELAKLSKQFAKFDGKRAETLS